MLGTGGLYADYALKLNTFEDIPNDIGDDLGLI